ncbi:MAG TPA: GDSL-type esterase/lipase family protein [Acetobacteraceae bacterium]|nr:GDSL-type esterase/lipase family protein [Acetobacteraceae bacterium]
MDRILSGVLVACLMFGAMAADARTRTHEHARAVLAATPIARLDLPWWKQRFEEKARRLREGRVGLVWYGDSITQDWERHGPPAWADFAPAWQRFYGDREAVNLGFTGDTTANLLWRVTHGEADGIAPKAAVILIGANNMGRLHWSAEDTVAGIDAIVAELRRRLPRTKLLLLGVLPSERSAWASRTTEAVNRALFARYSGGRVPGVTFLNEAGVFVRDGGVDRGAFLDPLLTPPQPPLHPTAQAQARLAAAIEPALSALMGDREHGG